MLVLTSLSDVQKDSLVPGYCIFGLHFTVGLKSHRHLHTPYHAALTPFQEHAGEL
jgi:hypothetical protein